VLVEESDGAVAEAHGRWGEAVEVPQARTSCWASPSGTPAMCSWAPMSPRGGAVAAGAHGGRLAGASTLEHFLRSVYASGSKPPVADACVIENPVGARDDTHQCVVGAQRVMALLYCTRAV
jgi:hypothetical protein